MMAECERKECLVGINKTLNNHFANVGNMVGRLYGQNGG